MAGMASQRHPEADRYAGPLLLSLGLHAAVLLLAFWGWSATPTVPDRPKVPSQVVQARILQMKPRAPVVAPKPQPVAEKPEPVEKPEPDPRIEEARRKAKQEEDRRRAEAEERRQAEARKRKRAEQKKQDEARKKAEARRREETRRQEDARRKAEAERREQEALKQRVREKLERLAQQQQAAQVQALQDGELVQSFQSAIRERVARYWSRPPSARNGMTVDLVIQLVPDGSVIEVVVQNSSGNAAFDRSAVQAVQRAGRLPVPDDPRLFDKEFRRFRMRFRPEDLSW